MAIKKEVINKITKDLSEDKIDPGFYNHIETILSNALSDVANLNNIDETSLNFFMAGDHVLDSNLKANSPLVVFVSLRSDKNKILAFEASERMNKRSKVYAQLATKGVLTDKALAEKLFAGLMKQFNADSKGFITDNIIILNVQGLIKLKVIVGYNYEGNFEYNYLGENFCEDHLQIIKAFDKKERNAKHFIDMARIIKSIELELLKLDKTQIKTFDKLYFVEHLLFNVPDELFETEEFYDSFIKILNYLKNVNLKDFKFAGSGEFMFTDKIKNAYYNALETNCLIKMLEYFYENFYRLY
jgi:hypothetical protein